MSVYFITKAWQHEEAFFCATNWLDTIEGAAWDWGRGASYINGRTYPSAVSITHEEDYLVFKIRWPELLKF